MEKMNSYAKPSIEPPKNPKELKKWKEQRKAEKRKWKEEKLIKQMLKQKEIEKREIAAKKQKIDEETIQELIGRNYTVSIAVPGSIMDNAQSVELRTYLAGQIGRAAAIFNVDEIIVFDETGSTAKTTDGEFTGLGRHGDGNVQLARVLQYLECPQYLRKSFFPQHRDLQYAGLLNPLNSPHHIKEQDNVPYREGVVLKKNFKEAKGSFVDVGLKKDVQIDRQLVAGIRVTVKMDLSTLDRKTPKGTVVAPSEPCTHTGTYWGYTVRLASSLSAVFTECPYKEMYDLTIGMSENGDSVDEFNDLKAGFKHLLIVFGGVKGLEAALEADESLKVDDPRLLFQHYLNACPNQGSRTIRTEELIIISLSALRPKLFRKQAKKPVVATKS